MRVRLFMLSALLLFHAGAAAAENVDLQLILAVDASGSVSQQRFELQRHGYALAFLSPQVLNAIQSLGGSGSIAVSLFQWTGRNLQAEIVPWTIVKDQTSAKAVADAIDTTPRELFGGGTSISGAIDHAMTLFPTSPFVAARKTIDVSGDGSNNNGRAAEDARDEAVSHGVVINGLPILSVEPDLDQYYRTHVIGGVGSFMIPVQNFEAFAEAIQRKLVAEIATLPPAAGRSAQQALAASPQSAIDR